MTLQKNNSWLFTKSQRRRLNSPIPSKVLAYASLHQGLQSMSSLWNSLYCMCNILHYPFAVRSFKISLDSHCLSLLAKFTLDLTKSPAPHNVPWDHSWPSLESLKRQVRCFVYQRFIENPPMPVFLFQYRYPLHRVRRCAQIVCHPKVFSEYVMSPFQAQRG